VEFPPDIQQQLVLQENPHGKISNSDLEMVGLILQWWVLKNFADLAHTHLACWCDNTTTVAGASRLLSTKAKKAARLLGILALRRLRARHWVNVLPAVSTHTFRFWMKSNSLRSYKLSLNGQGEVHSGEESESRPEASRQPSGPWPRRSCHANGGLSSRRSGNS